MKLFDNFGNDARTNGSAALTNSETETLFNSNRSDELNGHINVIARLAHFNAIRKLDNAGNVAPVSTSFCLPV